MVVIIIIIIIIILMLILLYVYLLIEHTTFCNATSFHFMLLVDRFTCIPGSWYIFKPTTDKQTSKQIPYVWSEKLLCMGKC
jgi:hypothetical protein